MGGSEMRIIDADGGIRVIIDDTYVIVKGETLVETRDNFLDMMGRVFDEAIYDSLAEDITEEEIGKCLTGGRGLSHIPNTVMMQIMKDGKESYDTLKEITDYMQKGSIGREMLDNLK
jgi:hypothetical protein